MNKLLAFQGNPEIKKKYLERLEMHHANDEIVKGGHWNNGKGCAVGCTLNGHNIHDYENKLGIPIELAYLEDNIFQGLENDIYKDFPIRFLSSININSNLEMIFYKFIYWMLIDKDYGIIQFENSKESIHIIKNIANLFDRKINRENIEKEEWVNAYNLSYGTNTSDSIYSASNCAASVCIPSYCCTAVDYATKAFSTNSPGADAKDYSAVPILMDASHKIRSKQADKLIELFKECH